MRKLVIGLTGTAALLLAGILGWSAEATTLTGAATPAEADALHAWGIISRWRRSELVSVLSPVLLDKVSRVTIPAVTMRPPGAPAPGPPNSLAPALAAPGR